MASAIPCSQSFSDVSHILKKGDACCAEHALRTMANTLIITKTPRRAQQAQLQYRSHLGPPRHDPSAAQREQALKVFVTWAEMSTLSLCLKLPRTNAGRAIRISNETWVIVGSVAEPTITKFHLSWVGWCGCRAGPCPPCPDRLQTSFTLHDSPTVLEKSRNS